MGETFEILGQQYHLGYVCLNTGEILVQTPSPYVPGWALASDDQAWPGAHGLGNIGWEALQDDDPRITDADRERLAWLLDEHR